MNKRGSILVVADRGESDAALLTKAARLARAFATELELFLCDAEQAYALKHAYEASGRDQALEACVGRAKEYLLRLTRSADLRELPVKVDAACCSPLYEGILLKVQKCRPDLVIKAAGASDRHGHSAFDANDWQLMHTCPTTLALVRGRSWSRKLRLAAAIDVSEEETEGLARTILKVAKSLAVAADAELDVLYAERSAHDDAASRDRAERLRAVAREAGLEASHVHVLAGRPEQELSAFGAGRNYDVMVLGALTHRKGAVTLVGTLTSVLVEALESDFVLVKPDTYRYPERKDVRSR